MSKLRSISTSFWSDTWVEDMKPTEKLLFLYLLTNDQTNMLGVYEISESRISFETGIDKATIRSAWKTFSGKVEYKHGHVVMYNYLKHQNFNGNMMKSAIDTYNSLPKELKLKGLESISQRDAKGFESLCKGFGMVRKVEVELEVELEVESKIEERKREFQNSLTPYLDQYGRDLLNDFFGYWTEHGPRDKKMRFEKEKSFAIERRLQTWAKNEKKFSGGSETKEKNLFEKSAEYLNR